MIQHNTARDLKLLPLPARNLQRLANAKTPKSRDQDHTLCNLFHSSVASLGIAQSASVTALSINRIRHVHAPPQSSRLRTLAMQAGRGLLCILLVFRLLLDFIQCGDIRLQICQDRSFAGALQRVI